MKKIADFCEIVETSLKNRPVLLSHLIEKWAVVVLVQDSSKSLYNFCLFLFEQKHSTASWVKPLFDPRTFDTPKSILSPADSQLISPKLEVIVAKTVSFSRRDSLNYIRSFPYR